MASQCTHLILMVALASFLLCIRRCTCACNGNCEHILVNQRSLPKPEIFHKSLLKHTSPLHVLNMYILVLNKKYSFNNLNMRRIDSFESYFAMLLIFLIHAAPLNTMRSAGVF